MLMLQRLLLVLVLVAASGWLAVHTAQAALRGQALDWSARLLDLAPEWQTMEPRELLLNGARFGIATGRSELPLTAMLDRLQASCRERSRLSAAPLSPGRALPSLSDGVLRVEGKDAGMIACLELGTEALGPREVLLRLQTFLQTGDLASVGPVRLVRVEAREQGSFFIAVANEGSLPLPRMFPSQGDAPGVDPQRAPRPVAARRILSVWQLGREPSIHVYEASGTLESSWQDYDDSLRRRGFEPLTEPQSDGQSRSALFAQGGHQLLVVAVRSDAGRVSWVLSALDHGGGHISQADTQPP